MAARFAVAVALYLFLSEHAARHEARRWNTARLSPRESFMWTASEVELDVQDAVRVADQMRIPAVILLNSACDCDVSAASRGIVHHEVALIRSK